MLAIPYTDNVFIHGDIVEASLAMPGQDAAKLSASERKWVASQRQLFWLLPDRYSKLVVHLAQHGEVDEAFGLARVIMEVSPDPRWADAKPEDRLFLSKEPVTRMAQWDYQQAAQTIGPALQHANARLSFSLFADVLERAMSLAEPIEGDDPADNSYIWRPAVEHHAQNLPKHSPRDVLVVATRDAAIQAAGTNRASIEWVVQQLESRKRSVFQRIAFHVLAELGSNARDVAASRLANWDNFEDTRVRHEYALLADQHFGDVSPRDRDRLLAHLREQPPMEHFRRNFASLYGREPTSDEVEQALRGIELRRLTIIKEHLSEEWSERYQELVQLCGGELAHPDFTSYSETGWVGPTSPKTADEIGDMTIDDLLDFLAKWHPPEGERFADSYDGLGRQLTAAVAADPQAYASNAQGFADLDPTYPRALIDGLDQALGANKSFDWPSILKLCEHVVAQQTGESEQDDAGWEDRDPGWRWARGSVARLLGEGMGRNDEAMIPISNREQLWRILSPLTEDVEPNPQHEGRFGGSNMDPLTLSINTNRGKAMHAVIRYALWVRRDDEKTHPERVQLGWKAISEVRGVLEAHLDSQVDPSPAIRAVYGERLPWLVLIDPEWVSSNLGRLFPTNPNEAPLREAMWETYLANNPYDNVFDLLKREYRRAVEELAELNPVTDRRRFVDPVERLAQHLMILYWRGRLTWDNEDGILPRFFDVAPDDARGEALNFVGHSLWRGDFEVPLDQSARLRELWSRRWGEVRRDPQGHRKEAAAFGWWFASKKLPDDWLLQQLLEVLAAGFALDADHLVLERLADLAQANPAETAHAVRLLISASPESHFLLISNEPLRRIVSIALDSDRSQAQQEGRHLLNELGAMGYRALDDLSTKI